MDTHDFISLYGSIYEHSPWVAECVASEAAGIIDADEIADLMAECVDNASPERQLALIRAHPDLAARARIADELTAASKAEQVSAGLHQCSKIEYERFEALNAAYKEKFGFPFVMAVRNSSRAEILEAFDGRLGNDPDTEFETALAEIHKIARLRLEAM